MFVSCYLIQIVEVYIIFFGMRKKSLSIFVFGRENHENINCILLYYKYRKITGSKSHASRLRLIPLRYKKLEYPING